jgi:hypothetical protein
MKNETSHNIEIYQLRIYIRHISPLIWRRILVRNDSTIADLHYTLQIAFGLSDSYLHQFVIRGKHYGITKDGGMYFPDDPYKIELKDFHFPLKERFLYEYNFYVPWEYEIRVEKTISLNSRKVYPVCIGGSRAAPPEDCKGPWTFMELKQKYSLFYIHERLLEIFKDKEEFEGWQKEITYFKYWLTTERFNRKTVNQYLKQYGTGDKGWEKAFEEVILI